VSNWESGPSDALKGRARGASDAQEALCQATAAGMPAGRPIYFSVDFDAQLSQQAVINDYFDGVASVLGRARTGAYGGFFPIQRLFDAGKITFGWQTFAWSGGRWEPRAQLRQVHNGVTIAGGACDYRPVAGDDFGQWGAATSPVADVEKLVAARNTDGTLEAFWIASGGAIQHARQTATGWSGRIGARRSGQEARDRRQRRRQARAVLRRHQTTCCFTASSSPPADGRARSRSPSAATELAVGRNADGRLEVVYTAPAARSDHAWQTAPNSTWSGASALGGAAKDVVIGATPTAGSRCSTSAPTTCCNHRVQLPAGGWSGELALGVSASDLAIGRNMRRRLELFSPARPASSSTPGRPRRTARGPGVSALGGAGEQARRPVPTPTVGSRCSTSAPTTRCSIAVQLPSGDWSDELTFGFSRARASRSQTQGRPARAVLCRDDGALSPYLAGSPRQHLERRPLLTGAVAP